MKTESYRELVQRLLEQASEAQVKMVYEYLLHLLK